MIGTTIALVLVGLLAAMFVVDTLQVLFRAVAAVLEAPVLGAHLGSVFMLLNRASAALALVAIGYLVDTAFPSRDLRLVYGVSALAIAVLHMPLLFRRPMFALTIRAFGCLYQRSRDSVAVERAEQFFALPRKAKAMPFVVIVTYIGLLGLLAPSLLALAYADYRATLMQTGFIINSVASIVNVMVVEKKIAIVLDAGANEAISTLYDDYAVSRAGGYILAAGTFLVSLVLGGV